MEKYSIQKAQKILSALYIITDLIKDTDAMKWEIREEGISFLSSISILNNTSGTDRIHAINLAKTSSSKLESLLMVALVSQLISKMNHNIVANEIESLTVFINKNSMEEIHPPGYILSDSFFATDVPQLSLKSHNSESRTEDKPMNKSILIKDKKNNRQESILSLLKKDSNLTIKDFTKVIKDCSEKTIQRELIELVEKGLIKKLGERRWSTYSLV